MRIASFEERSCGFALVTVVLCLVLITLLALAVFSSIRTETTSSSAHAEGQRARSLAPNALNIVMAQIRAATLENNTVWTSQPGALKTFEGNRSLKNVYKLYSSDLLTQPGSAFDPALDRPADWKSRPDEFVDLNARWPGSAAYPILDPGASGLVDGFSITAGTSLEMPVRWLYILKDGSVTTLDKISTSNPAVARIAFWTDDETCKLNLNTASEGTFWTAPLLPAASGSGNAMQAISVMRELSQRQPLQWEYQRYPGHPATTSLSPVLWKLLGNPASYLSASQAQRNTYRESLYTLLPRTRQGGSQGGTLGIANLSTPLALKAERHFTAPDELFFKSDRSQLPGLSEEDLGRMQFFLTSSSRSPDINLFKKPKISMWPVHEDPSDAYRTPFDRLSAFASTVGGNAFHFTRSDPYSRTKDLHFGRNKNQRNIQMYR